MQETYERRFRREFKSVWKKLRMYNSIWAHPNFYFQNDQLFSKASSALAFEKMEDNLIYELRIDKQESKNRARYLLTPRLKEPQIVRDFESLKDKKEGAIKLESTFPLLSNATSDESKLFSLNQCLFEYYSHWKGE